MVRFEFGLSVEVDKKSGDILAAYFRVRRGKSAKVKEFAEGKAFADYDRKGRLLGIELLEPCKITVLDQITAKEPTAKAFVRKSIPREMAMT